jgi:hypothetical protein
MSKAPKRMKKTFAPLANAFLAINYPKSITFNPAMKNIFLFVMLVCLAMISSCQKQDSAIEQRLAQREAALDQREKALDDREKALIQRERIMANFRAVRPEPQPRQPSRDAAELQAERERRIQQLPPEFRALIPDASKIQAERAKRTQEQIGQTRGSAQPDTTSQSASPTP